MIKEERKRNERGITLLGIIIGTIVVILVGIIIINNTKNKGREEKEEIRVEGEVDEKEEYVHILEDGSKLNISKEMQKEKKLKKLEIKNVQLKEKGGITTLLADIENKGEEVVEERIVKVEIINKKGEIITTIEGPIDTVEAGGKVQLNLSVTGDISNAYDFRISE